MNTLLQLAAVLATVTFSSTNVVDRPNDNFELLILHNNDMHARFEQTSQLSGTCTPADRDAGKCYGGFARVAHVVKEARKAAANGEGPPVLYLNAGDTYTGTAWFTIYKWKIAAEFINALQPDAVSLGNHEFDEAVEGVVPFIRNLSSPVLAANLIMDNVPELEMEPNLYKSIVLVKKFVKIGIIGYLTPETKNLAPKNKVEYEDEVIALRREVCKLKEQGVNILIALGHSGFIKDLEIARRVKDIDLVIGGHSNTFLWNSNSTAEKPEFPQGPYPTIVKQKSGRMVPVVQAYAYTKYMGKLHVIFDIDGEIIQYDGTPILLNNEIPKDPEILELVNKYRKNIDKISNEVVGSSMVFLNGEDCRLRECNIGNVITDSLLYYTEQYHYEDYPNVNIALTQGGRIRASIQQREELPFNVTRGDWITVLPFSDTLTILTMNGTILKQTLEHSVDAWRTIDTSGQFLQFSGMKVIYDLAKSPGSRVIDAKAVCSNCYEPELSDIQDKYEYRLIMSTFLADTGDGYKMFEDLPKETVPYNEVTSVLAYLKDYSPIKPRISGRITLLNEDKVTQNSELISAKINTREGRTLPSSAKGYHTSYNICFIVLLLQILYQFDLPTRIEDIH